MRRVRSAAFVRLRTATRMLFHCAFVIAERNRFCARRQRGPAPARMARPLAVRCTPRLRRSASPTCLIQPFLFNTPRFLESVVLSKASVLMSVGPSQLCSDAIAASRANCDAWSEGRSSSSYNCVRRREARLRAAQAQGISGRGSARCTRLRIETHCKLSPIEIHSRERSPVSVISRVVEKAYLLAQFKEPLV